MIWVLTRAEDAGVPWAEFRIECLCGESSWPANPTTAEVLRGFLSDHSKVCPMGPA